MPLNQQYRLAGSEQFMNKGFLFATFYGLYLSLLRWLNDLIELEIIVFAPTQG